MTSSATPVAPPTTAEVALRHRIDTALHVLAPVRPDTSLDPTMDLVVQLVEAAQTIGDHASTWLAIIALTGAYPTPDLVRTARRALELKESEDAAVWLLGAVTSLAFRRGSAESRMRIVHDRPLVDVSSTAQSDLLTGIQRVVRGVASQWDGLHDIELVAWTSNEGAYRPLQDDERHRLLQPQADAFDEDTAPTQGGPPAEVLVPWTTPVVLTEVPRLELNDRLAAVAEFTQASVRLVGYDCIPVASAETVPLAEPEKFGRYLELVKHADRVAAISATAAAEFRGFVSALAAQGLPGPAVSACDLPSTTPVLTPDESPGERPDRPVVASIGTIGRRKNQTALLEAAELLWRDGLEFEVHVLGHMGEERTPFAGLARELRAAGRPLVVQTGVSDAKIASTLAHARCVVFTSLHEGFGLPVVEALSHGVPVITSDFGSLREVAEDQGGVLVNPEDPDELTEALRSLLVDDALHARLVAQAHSRPVRTWSHYATDLWEALVR
jgi:hypothetical protein